MLVEYTVLWPNAFSLICEVVNLRCSLLWIIN